LKNWQTRIDFKALPLNSSPNIRSHPYTEADKAARDFAAFIALAYRLSARKTRILDRKYEIPGLNLLLKQKRKSQKNMARKQGSSMQSDGKLSLSKYQEDGLEKSS
jgi:hypothetical protein